MAFMDGVTRVVNIPDENETKDNEAILGAVFYYGQNEFQEVANCCSVSVGDVVNLRGKRWLVLPFGFSEMMDKEWEEYCSIPRLDRSCHCYRKVGAR